MDIVGQVETYSGKCISKVTCEWLFALLYYQSMAYLLLYRAPVLGETEGERMRERDRDRER
jgi:hypothetical protein